MHSQNKSAVTESLQLYGLLFRHSYTSSLQLCEVSILKQMIFSQIRELTLRDFVAKDHTTRKWKEPEIGPSPAQVDGPCSEPLCQVTFLLKVFIVVCQVLSVHSQI